MEYTLDQLNLINIRLTTILTAVSLGILAIFYRNLPPLAPLLYTLSWGDEQIVARPWLFILPGLVIITGVISALVISRLNLERLLLYIWLGTVWAFQVIVMLATVRIVWLIV